MAVHTAMHHGAVMSLRGTASGRLFAAWLPRQQVRSAAAGVGFDKSFEKDLAAIRLAGLSHAVDAAAPGVSGLAAPVFDGTGTMVLSLTTIGVTPSFDTRPEAAAALALRRCAGELSAQLGAPGRPQAA